MELAGERRHQALALLKQALERPAGERASFLAAACPTDPELRQYILEAASDDDRTHTDFLEESVSDWLVDAGLKQGMVLGNRFRVLRRVGRGGMGEVYEAADMLLGSRVALKTIRRDLAGLGEASNRFLQEIHLAQQVTHPNVCRVYDLRSEEVDGLGEIAYFTMEYLDGETLADRCERDGPVPAADALEIARQVASGLAAAHERGVIHRDLKSSNVILSREGGGIRAVVTDFGIARSHASSGTSSSGSSSDSHDPGGSGTPDYMAPERWRAREDARTVDIYSYGVILYEMVTGQMPFPSGTPLEARLRSLPPAPSTVVRGLSTRWDRVILRCLDPSPERRYPDIRMAVEDLEGRRTRKFRWAAAAAGVAALAGSAWYFTAGPVSRKVLAVLPFEVTGSTGMESGLVDQLVDQLERRPAVRGGWMVIPPREAKSSSHASRVFGATHVLQGRITRDADSITVRATLADTTGAVRDEFQRTCLVDNAACLQEGLAQSAAAMLGDKESHTPAEPRIAKEALPHYLQGLSYLHRDSVSYDLAIPFFERARVLDASAPQIRVALADAYLLKSHSVNQPELVTTARGLYEGVLRSYPNLAEVHSGYGNLLREQGQLNDALDQLRKAVELDPADHRNHRRLALAYVAAHRDAEAEKEFKRAIELQPRFWAGYLDYGAFCFSRQRYQEGEDLLNQLLQWAPDHPQGHSTLGGILLSMGKLAEAERVLKRGCELAATRVCLNNLALVYQKRNRHQEAIAVFQRALAAGRPSEQILLNLAESYKAMSNPAEATKTYRQVIRLAEEGLKADVGNGSRRGALAYALAQIGEGPRAGFEMEQARQAGGNSRMVTRYGVLVYEKLGKRDEAIAIARDASKDLIAELAQLPELNRLRQDPRFRQLSEPGKQ